MSSTTTTSNSDTTTTTTTTGTKTLDVNDEVECKKAETEQSSPDIELREQELMDPYKLCELMKRDGPVVKALLLNVDGTISEVDYDTTPRRCHIHEILGGTPTFVGQWSDLGVFVVKVAELDDAPLNQHKLRFPLGNEEIRGPIFLYRAGDHGTCLDFPLEEYQEFVSKSSEDEGKVWKTEEEEDQVVPIEEMKQTVEAMVTRQFLLGNNRLPTEEEKALLVESVLQAMGADEEELDEMIEEEEELFGEVVNENENDKEEEKSDETAQLVKEDEDEDKEDIDNDEFDRLFDEALANIRNLAGKYSKLVLDRARDNYKQQTGEECDDDTLIKGFKLLNLTAVPESDDIVTHDFIVDDDEDDEECEVPLSEEEMRKEVQQAMEAVRRVALEDGNKLAAKVSQSFKEMEGREPNEEELAQMINEIKEKLRNDDFALYDEDDDEDDSDYDPNNEEDQEQEARDRLEDMMLAEECDKENKPSPYIVKKPIAFFSPLVTKTKTSDGLMRKRALLRFEKTHGRKPTLEEIQQLDSFLNCSPSKSVQVKKPIAFFSPLVTKDAPRTDSMTRRRRALQRFEKTNHRQPTQEELVNLDKFLNVEQTLVTSNTSEDNTTRKLILDDEDEDEDENDSEYKPEEDEQVDCNDDEEYNEYVQEIN